MAIQVKDPGASAAKYAARAGGAAAAYSAGINSPKRPWAATTVAAQATYGQGVQAAIANNSFAKGVQKAGDGKWQANATGKGAQRYPSGVQAGQSNYAAAVTPYFNAIANVQLPPRFPKGDPQNVNRVTAIINALRAHKVGK